MDGAQGAAELEENIRYKKTARAHAMAVFYFINQPPKRPSAQLTAYCAAASTGSAAFIDSFRRPRSSVAVTPV
jgi:hypothetical protein